MTYRVEISPKAVKFLSEVPKCDKERIRDRIKELSENPRNENVIKLKGNEISEYRARQGNYRIFFNIKDDVLVVEVIDILPRKDSYR
ncbi:MAG: type II toxin-antitoxin system RelE/ParE family toxin [Syntrophaceae bacterium]|nr:type II toxin-antitoxin system RelE/ParE family toxin [Syntrophaceae bacterium]